MRLDLTEHKRMPLVKCTEVDFNLYFGIKPKSFTGRRNEAIPCYKLHVVEEGIEIQSDYCIGIDWLVPEKKYVYVAPKLNAWYARKFIELSDTEEQGLPADKDAPPPELKELNYLRMYLDAADHPDVAKHVEQLLIIDWESPEIEIEQKDDLLTPFLIVQFLNLLKQIVRKGLKRSYYTVQKILQNKIKGKILVSQHIKTNVIRNRYNSTLCEYQEFGTDSHENRFLKRVLLFVSKYLSNNASLFGNCEPTLRDYIGYCTPAFENISAELDDHQLKHIKVNSFFKEYKLAISTGQQILKRFAYNISIVSEKKGKTPPFWINMPRLFELYVYRKLLSAFPSDHVHYQFSTYGNELDFLITDPDHQMVIDAKYKLHYTHGHVHEDIRQVAGYARLNKVYEKLNKDDSKIIDCVIIYPHPDLGVADFNPDDLKVSANRIKAYKNVFKLGITLP